MKKIIIFSLLAVSMNCKISYAAPLPPGSVVQDINFVDINGHETTLYDYLDQGYTVFIELGATWCNPCWQYKKTQAFQDIYDHYGPNGTFEPEKIMPIFIEIDPKTNMDDLLGKTGTTQGDWISGVTYPIIDADSWDMAQHFLTPGSGNRPATPTFLMICPDRKVIWSGEGTSTAATSEEAVVRKANTCVTTRIDQMEKDYSFAVYPNPAIDKVTLTSKQPLFNAKVRLIDLLGKVLSEESFSGRNTFSIDLSGYATGMYIIEVSEGHKVFRSKVQKR